MTDEVVKPILLLPDSLCLWSDVSLAFYKHIKMHLSHVIISVKKEKKLSDKLFFNMAVTRNKSQQIQMIYSYSQIKFYVCFQCCLSSVRNRMVKQSLCSGRNKDICWEYEKARREKKKSGILFLTPQSQSDNLSLAEKNNEAGSLTHHSEPGTSGTRQSGLFMLTLSQQELLSHVQPSERNIPFNARALGA